MRFKRLLALLLAAALALSLLAGCGGGQQSVSQVLLNLLDGQYQNVSVEIDSDLEAKLRQAISQSETDEELRAALEQLLGGGISFQRLGSGQQGDSAWTLIIYPGTDPDAAARSVYLDLDKVFAALPDDGVYSSGFAMAEMENGYAILVKATVDKAGTEDKPDPVTLESIKVTKDPKLEYWVGESFDPAGMVITATYSNNTTKTISDITASDKKGVSWTPDGALAEGSHEITITYGGKTTTVSVTVEEPTVKSLTVEPASLTYTAGDTFDPKALRTITATYTDGKTETVLPENCDFYLGSTKITLPHQFTTAGNYTLKVSYEGVKAEIPLTVNFGTVTRITVSGPNKKEYELNETFNPDGLVVTAHDGYGNSESVSDYTFTITDENNKEVYSPYKFDTAGTYTLTVSYNNMEATVEITVNPATVTGIKVTTQPTRTTYFDGESFDPAGMTITATYSDGTTNPVTSGYTWLPKTLSKDTTEVTISYGGQSTTVEVKILSEGNSYNATSKTYFIATADGLLAWNKAVQSNLSLNCILTENIDLKDKAWTPIGSGFSSSTGYQGTFNGGGHTITELTITTNSTDGGNAVLFDGIGSNGTVKNLQVEVNYNVQQGVASGIVNVNYGTITACSVTGDIAARTSDIGGIASINNGSIIGCWFDGNLTTNYVEGGIAAYNYGTITACFYGGNAGYGANNQGGTVDATKVNDGDLWQTAVDGMNKALTDNDYKWTSGTDGLPTLKKQ